MMHACVFDERYATTCCFVYRALAYCIKNSKLLRYSDSFNNGPLKIHFRVSIIEIFPIYKVIIRVSIVHS